MGHRENQAEMTEADHEAALDPKVELENIRVQFWLMWGFCMSLTHGDRIIRSPRQKYEAERAFRVASRAVADGQELSEALAE